MELRKLLAILTIVSLFVVSLAGTPSNWVQNGIALRQGANIEWQRSGAAIGEDAVSFVWSDTRRSDRDLWAQAVNSEGLVWNDGESVSIKMRDNRQEDPVMIKTSEGNAVIAWIDFHWQVEDIDEACVVAQKISPEGELLWESSVLLNEYNVGLSLNIVPNNDDGAFIIWHDIRSGVGTDIYGINLNGDGEPFTDDWLENGTPLAHGRGEQHFHTLWDDGHDGAMLAHVNEVDNIRDLHVKRIGPDGNIIWERELAADPVIQYASARVQPFGDDAFGFAYTDRRDGFDKMYLQVIDLDGNDIWEESLPVDPEADGQPYTQIAPRVVGTSDGNFVVTWEDRRYGPRDIFAQKFDIDGNRLWDERGVPIVINEYDQTEPRMECNGEGGVLLVWEDAREGGHPNIDVYMQMLDADGQIQYEENGRPVVQIDGEAFAPLAKFTEDGHFYIGWGDMRTGSVGIYVQGYTMDGEQLFEDNGIRIYWGLSGDSIDHIAVKNEDYVYTVWQDTRYAFFGSQIKVQKLDREGNILFDENGISVTAHTGANQESGTGQSYISVVPHHSGGIALAWREQRADNELVYTQAIDPDGEMLWDPDGTGLGVRVSATDDVYSQDNPTISRRGESYIIVYDETDPGDDWTYARDVRAQKIIDGEKHWGDEGIHIAWQFGGFISDHVVREVIDGEYILWRRGGQFGADGNIFYMKRIDEDGNAVEGWDEYGEVVVDYPGYLQTRPAAVLTDEGVLVIWEDQRAREGAPRNASLYGQLISPEGEMMWAENGAVLADYENDQALVSLSYHEDGYAYFAWRDARLDARAQDVSFQKINEEGELMWGDPAPFAVRSRTEQDDPVISVVGDKVLVVWENNYGERGSDIHMQIASTEDGGTYWDPEGEPLVSLIKRQIRPRAIPFDENSSYVVWADGRSSGKEEIIGLYAQSVDMFFGNVEDDHAVKPIDTIALHANYPNPFNPETTISFALGQNENVSLNVYNVRGQLIRTLVDDDYLERGNHSFVWNGTDNNGNHTGSGVYFYKLESEEQVQVRKMLLLK